MCELLGAALDAAVARALGLSHIVEHRPTNPPTPCAVWLVRKDQPDWVTGHYDPSRGSDIAMGLLQAHDMAVYPDPLAHSVGVEKWVAGFNIEAKITDPPVTTEAGTYLDGEAGINLDHAARGATPQIAICRAIVNRSTQS